MTPKEIHLFVLTLCAVFLLASCGGGGGGNEAQAPPGASPVGTVVNAVVNDAQGEPQAITFTRVTANSGGATTLAVADQNAFNRAAPNLSPQNDQEHRRADRVFADDFNPAGSNNDPGLGPIFNSERCEGCHIRNGRGAQPPPGQPLQTMLLRVSIPGADAVGGPNPAPGFGGQLQDKAINGVAPEAGVSIAQTVITGAYADGTPYSLLQPVFSLFNPYIPLPPDLLISPRVAPAVFGLGLLEAVPESTILALADEFDADGDGISGRPNRVWNVVTGQQAVGRFGWKAGQPTLLQQSAAAFRNDMGVTNPLFDTDPSTGQAQDDGLPDDPEINGNTLDLAAFYVQTLAVPARRNVNDPTVLRGEEVFHGAGCAKCHVPTLVTGAHVAPTSVPGDNGGRIAELDGQTIHPFTDLLLHDMGPGLADNRPAFTATGQEWRTAPLWGAGLSQVVNGHTRYLHDGRARNLAEAILWHGGEGQTSKVMFENLPATDRDALLAFLGSL